jgi:hypothetical protein
MPFGFVFVFVFEHHEDYERTFVHSDHSHLWDLRDGLERRLRRRPYSPWRGCRWRSPWARNKR